MHAVDQRAHDGGAAAVVRMGDARMGMGGFEMQVERAVRAAVEGDAPVQQALDGGGAVLRHAVDGLRIAQVRAGGERVGGVSGGAVLRVEGGGDAALR